MLRNPWVQLLSTGCLWPHKISGLSPFYLLDFGEVVLGSSPVPDIDEDTKYPHLYSVHRYLLFLLHWKKFFWWLFWVKWWLSWLLTTQWHQHPRSLILTTGSYWPGRRTNRGSALVGRLALCIFTMYRRQSYSGCIHPPTGCLRNQQWWECLTGALARAYANFTFRTLTSPQTPGQLRNKQINNTFDSLLTQCVAVSVILMLLL